MTLASNTAAHGRLTQSAVSCRWTHLALSATPTGINAYVDGVPIKWNAFGEGSRDLA